MNVRFGPFELDSGPRQLKRSGEVIHLTPKVFDLLVVLLESAPRIVRKDELHQRLWPGTFVSDATLASLVKELRHALGDSGSPPVVRTAHRVGYAFAAPIDRASVRESGVSRWVVVGRRKIALADGEHVIGREPASAICFEATGVSRRHARIVVGASDTYLEDLGSKNGTTLNGRPIDGRVVLADGDEIHVGPAVVLYRCSGHGQSTETSVRARARRGPT